MPAGKTLLRVNLDETPICLFQGHVSGNIFLAKSTTTAQNVPRWTRRAYLTHVAFVCDNPEIQFVLPQVIIANERTLPASQLATVRALCAPNVKVLRAKSAWVNEHIIGQLIRWLAASLQPHLFAFQPLLLFDAAPQHLGPAVWRACSAVRIWPLLVPAKLTWLLQVLDTHVFAAYKVFLQKAYQETRVRTDNGHVGIAELVASVQAAIKTILEARHCTGAFDQNGFSAGQARVSNRVLHELNVVTPVHLPSSRQRWGNCVTVSQKAGRSPKHVFGAVVTYRCQASQLLSQDLSGTRLHPCRHQTGHQTLQSQSVLELDRALRSRRLVGCDASLVPWQTEVSYSLRSTFRIPW